MPCEVLNFFEIPCCHYYEEGVGIGIDRKGNEIIRFYLIDRNTNNAEYREKRQEISDGEICDLIISYKLRNNEKIIFCLVELKGAKINHAIDQICRVFDFLQTKNCCHQTINWKAYICSNVSSPVKKNDSFIIKLKQRFQPGDYKISKNRVTDPFANFLRDC